VARVYYTVQVELVQEAAQDMVHLGFLHGLRLVQHGPRTTTIITLVIKVVMVLNPLITLMVVEVVQAPPLRTIYLRILARAPGGRVFSVSYPEL